MEAKGLRLTTVPNVVSKIRAVKESVLRNIYSIKMTLRDTRSHQHIRVK